MPRPSSGVYGRRSNGFAANNITHTKNAATTAVTPATYGRYTRWRPAVSSCASDPNSVSTVAQKSRLPFCPAYSADQV